MNDGVGLWGGLGLWGGMGLSGDCGAELSVERTAILGPAKGHDIFVWRPSCVCVTTTDDSPVAICPALASAAVVGMFLKRTFSFPVFVQCPMPNARPLGVRRHWPPTAGGAL